MGVFQLNRYWRASSFGPTNTLDSQGIRNADWENVGGGDGFYVRIDPNDPSVVYTESQNGSTRRLDMSDGVQRAADFYTARAKNTSQ